MYYKAEKWALFRCLESTLPASFHPGNCGAGSHYIPVAKPLFSHGHLPMTGTNEYLNTHPGSCH
jgi:hypothetical protein